MSTYSTSATVATHLGHKSSSSCLVYVQHLGHLDNVAGRTRIAISLSEPRASYQTRIRAPSTQTDVYERLTGNGNGLAVQPRW